jgi:hypothetical protein
MKTNAADQCIRRVFGLAPESTLVEPCEAISGGGEYTIYLHLPPLTMGQALAILMAAQNAEVELK